MDCKGAEKLILRFFDGRLSKVDEHILENHLKKCSSCREKEKQYAHLFAILRKEEPSEPLPYFRERLLSRLKERKKVEPWTLGKWWSVRVVPVFLVFILLFVSALVFFLPGKEEMSQTEVLLLHNINPLRETSYLLEEKNVEDKNMMLIFSTSEEKIPERRNLP